MAGKQTTDEYWASRKGAIYYQVVQVLTSGLSKGAQSLIDVGSAGGDYVLGLGDIPDIASLDMRSPNKTPGVRSIVSDFLQWEPDKRYDVVTCFQVLEHVPDAEAFAQKLLQTGDIVVVSVPYRWRKGATKSHVHDPVDKPKMLAWFKRPPNYEYICREPTSDTARLIQVYDNTGSLWRSLNERKRILSGAPARPFQVAKARRWWGMLKRA